MKVLVSTASKHGSTEEIGARISEVLLERGHQVDVRATTEVDEVSRYDVVVLGSAIYAGHWQKDAKELVEREGEVLASRPVWLFSSGPVGDPLKPEEGLADVDSVIATTHAYDHHLFSGKLDRQCLSLPERAIVKALHVPEGDYRDWQDVDTWATSIADSISSG